MKEDYWFVKRGPGLLFIPVNWKGWVSILVFFGLLVMTFYLNKTFTRTALLEHRVRLVFELVIVIVVSVMFFASHAKRTRR